MDDGGKKHPDDPGFKTAHDSETFVIVVSGKNGRQHTVRLTPEQAIEVAKRIKEASKKWKG